MVRDFKYVLKRIAIGVGIALVLGFIKGNLLMQTHALVYGNSTAGYSINLGNTLSDVDYSLPNSIFNGLGGGTLTFNIGLSKQTATGTVSTAPVVVPRSIFVSNGVANYPCYTGSFSSQNSTWDSSFISVQCPFDANLNGLVSIHLRFSTSYSSGNESNYLLIIGGPISFQTEVNTTVNVDTSSTNSAINGTTNAINNQISNDNNNTQSIINNNNSNTNSIINNQDSNTQDIIDNQNANSQAEIESQKVCNSIDRNSITTNNKYLSNSQGLVSDSQNYGITDFISITNSTIKVINDPLPNTGSYLCFYNVNKSLISCIANNSLSINQIIDIPSYSSYVRFSINRPNNKPQFEICTNGNQAIVDSNNQLNNSITDTSGGEVDSSWFDDFDDDSTSPISDLLTMPITLLQAYIDGFSNTCQDINLGQLYGTYLIIPCINIEEYLGSSLWSLIDTLFSIFMIYNIAMLCITIYEGITSLNDDFSWLYGVEARHAGVPSRVERNSDLY